MLRSSLKLTVKYKAILRMADNNTLLKIIQIWESDSGVVFDGWVKIHRCLQYTHFHVWNSLGTGGGRGGGSGFFLPMPPAPAPWEETLPPGLQLTRKGGKKVDGGLGVLAIKKYGVISGLPFCGSTPGDGSQVQSKQMGRRLYHRTEQDQATKTDHMGILDRAHPIFPRVFNISYIS